MSSAVASSSSSTTTVPSTLVVPISKKLMKSNFPLWHAQVLPAVRAAQLDDFLTGEEKHPEKEITVIVDEKSIKQRNPTYTAWMARDQVVLGYLLSCFAYS
jgi:alpha-D-ribose 1-methylphosphonate 5-triphosphate synthase subunit PhnH